ncbi:MAG: hypothetical protein QXT43_00305 [Candidatus Micrarchaeaceae archaeon]
MKLRFRAQSAMEYLMTYGWAILIIAVVLGALFSLGVFSSSSFLGTACIPQSGFLCSNPTATSGLLSVTIGQATGATWSSAEACFVPTGTTVPSSCSQDTSNDIISGGLVSGQTEPVSFTISQTTLGAGVSGQIWVTYSVSGGASNLMTEVGTVTAKVS